MVHLLRLLPMICLRSIDFAHSCLVAFETIFLVKRKALAEINGNERKYLIAEIELFALQCRAVC